MNGMTRSGMVFKENVFWEIARVVQQFNNVSLQLLKYFSLLF